MACHRADFRTRILDSPDLEGVFEIYGPSLKLTCHPRNCRSESLIVLAFDRSGSSLAVGPLLQCPVVADWRQIQARIRKAKNAADPLAKLSELYLRTRDAMVAWELGTIHEKNGQTEEAVKWYKTAWEKFRRADWKKKAEEALTRMGEEVPPSTAVAVTEESVRSAEGVETGEEEAAAVVDSEGEESETESETATVASSASPAQDSGNYQAMPRGKRRRGRRGGRGRHRREGAPAAAPALPSRSYTESASAESSNRRPIAAASERAPEPVTPRESSRASVLAAEPPMLPSERAAHGHRDPGLASRMAQLESMLRRLVSSPLHKVDAIDEAPAGPGVYLLSDSDQTGYYYVEACQTLRVGLSNLVRGGGRGNRSGGSRGRIYSDTDLKARLAEHLEINESKVGQYLKDHCVVRWIQLDEEAPHLAHFAIGVLRTPLNAD